MRRVGTLGLVAALAAILVSPLPAHAEEASGAVTYNAGNGYSFEKLSHPTVGTSQPDGIVDYQGNGAVAVPGADGNTANNEGDRGQSYTWAAASYGDWLYVGTCYAAMGNTLTLMNGTLGDSFDAETMRLTLEAMFNGTFFYGQQKEDGTADKDSGGILVKINTKTGETKLLLSESLNGVGPLFRNAVSYKGKLYFCGSVRTNGGKSGLPAVYEIDPKTDDWKVVYQGLSSADDYRDAYKQGISTGIRGMCVHDGQLVISNVGKDANGNFVSTILTSSDPSKGPGSFTEIANSGTLFNYPAIRYKDSIYGGAIWDMVSYNGHLYATICTGTPENAPDDNSMQSFAMVRGDKNADGFYSNFIYMPCTEENGFMPDLPKETPDVIYLCFPNNPTGMCATKAQLKKWVDYALANDALIIFDSAYEAFIVEDDVPHSIYEIEGAEKCAIELRSFSKTAGFTGVRCGYTVVPKACVFEGKSLNPMWARRQATKFNGVSYITQRAAEAVYTEQGQKEIKETLAYYQKNAKVIFEGMQAAGFTCYGAVNSPYVWLKVPEGMTSWEFFDLLLDKTHVVGTPGSGFGPSGEGFFRLTAFGNADKTVEAVERIKAYFAQNK